MRRTRLAVAVVGACVLGGLLLWLRPSAAGPDRPAPDVPGGNAAVRPAAALPVTGVMLYSSGVGYFQRSGKVQGSCRVDLSFPAQDINDLLKSLVLRDLSGGKVSAVAYDSHDPIDKTLKSFALNLDGNPSFANLLNQARGEKVEAVLQQSSASQPGTLTGAIVSVEKQKLPAAKDAVVEADFLNLWCAEGLRSVKLADVQRLRFLNPQLEGEVRKALEVLALGHDAQKKAVSLSFTGEGEREVRVGYVVESPIWKTSYRLVLSKEGQPQLQGWAVVENPSDEDWNQVGMVLVSGRPISFQMDLYTPLYVPRPVVEPELFASLRPPTYEGAMGGQAKAPVSASARGPAPAPGLPTLADEARPHEGEKQVLMGINAPQGRGGEPSKDTDLDLRQGVQSAATAIRLGDSFRYVIDEPVSLGRQKSAMLPIVGKEVEAERVSIYNENTLAKFPLLGLRFHNTTGLHLMQGPVTVFEGNAYAGDSRILDVQPGEQRLLSYAIDLGTEVDPVVDNPRQTLTKVRLLKGILYSTTQLIESKTYKVQNRSEQERTLLIEHPFRPDFHLTSKDKPAETARDVYRFELKVPASKDARTTVTEERDLQSQVVLSNTDDNTIRVFLQSNATSKAAQEALRKALELKGKADLTRQDLAHAQQQLADIERDQVRLRANLKETPPTAEAYKKYLAKLDRQENDVDTLRDQIKKLQDQQLQQQKDYDAFLNGLDVE